MINQVLKDFRITRIFWAPAVFSFSVFLLIFFPNKWAFFVTAIALTMTLVILILLIDDMYKTSPLFAALPGSRKTIVAGRYLTWVTVSAVGAAVTLATVAGILAVLSSRAAHLEPLLSARWGLALFLSSVLIGLLYLPFYFRFGLGRSTWIFGSFCLGILIVFSFLAPLLVGLTGQTPKAVDGVPPSLLSAYTFLQWAVGRAGEGSRYPLTVLLAGMGTAILFFISKRISADFYRKRDL